MHLTGPGSYTRKQRKKYKYQSLVSGRVTYIAQCNLHPDFTYTQYYLHLVLLTLYSLLKPTFPLACSCSTWFGKSTLGMGGLAEITELGVGPLQPGLGGASNLEMLLLHLPEIKLLYLHEIKLLYCREICSYSYSQAAIAILHTSRQF